MIRPPRHRGGFTLLELLVTMAIGSILLLVAATMLGRAGDSYSQGSGSVAAEREARAVLTQMGEDFAKAVWHKDNVFEAGGEGWKRARTGFLSLQPEDALDLLDAGFADTVRFFAHGKALLADCVSVSVWRCFLDESRLSFSPCTIVYSCVRRAMHGSGQ
jgi:prepilin-type N-terminal cleavage/methylation domain-containing protein